MSDTLKAKWQRMRNRWWIFKNTGLFLDNRTKVQQYLYNCASGKTPLPDRGKCKELAIQLSQLPTEKIR